MGPRVAFLVQVEHLFQRVAFEQFVQVPEIFFAPTAGDDVYLHGHDIVKGCETDTVDLLGGKQERIGVKEIDLHPLVFRFSQIERFPERM